MVVSLGYKGRVFHFKFDFKDGEYISTTGRKFPTIPALVEFYSTDKRDDFPLALKVACPLPSSVAKEDDDQA